MQEFKGQPPYCRPECISNSECSPHLACINQKCKDPCIGACGSNAECRVVSHSAMCVCPQGFEGDPFTQCIIRTAIEILSPCTPSPCGPNAVCKEQNKVGSCTCNEGYFGNPYEGCRPECVTNSDCPGNRACINNKCQDPCPGTCGINAECTTINHSPTCVCISGYTGDAFRRCNPIPRKYILTFQYCHFLQSNLSYYNDNIIDSIGIVAYAIRILYYFYLPSHDVLI